MKSYSELTLHEKINLKYNCFGHYCTSTPVQEMWDWKLKNHIFRNCSFLFCPDYSMHNKNY